MHKGMNQYPRGKSVWETRLEMVRSSHSPRLEITTFTVEVEDQDIILTKGLLLHILTLYRSQAVL